MVNKCKLFIPTTHHRTWWDFPKIPLKPLIKPRPNNKEENIPFPNAGMCSYCTSVQWFSCLCKRERIWRRFCTYVSVLVRRFYVSKTVLWASQISTVAWGGRVKYEILGQIAYSINKVLWEKASHMAVACCSFFLARSSAGCTTINHFLRLNTFPPATEGLLCDRRQTKFQWNGRAISLLRWVSALIIKLLIANL